MHASTEGRVMLIGITYDLKDEYLSQGYSQEDVAELDSQETVDAIENTLWELGWEAVKIGNVRSLIKALEAGKRWDLVFNISEGLLGRSREAQVPAVLEAYGIPYTFGDPLTNAITLDKAMAKRILISEGIPTPKFFLCSSPKEVEGVTLEFPLFVKPNHEGTGRGIDEKSLVYDKQGLFQKVREILFLLGQPALVEEYLPGREFTVGIMGYQDTLRPIGTMEVIVVEGPGIYSYGIKESWRGRVRYEPLKEGGLKQEIEELALKAYRILGLRDVGRIDIRLSGSGRPMFLEANPLPGLNPTNSDLPILASSFGLEYKELIGGIVLSALKRSGLRA